MYRRNLNAYNYFLRFIFFLLQFYCDLACTRDEAIKARASARRASVPPIREEDCVAGALVTDIVAAGVGAGVGGAAFITPAAAPRPALRRRLTRCSMSAIPAPFAAAE